MTDLGMRVISLEMKELCEKAGGASRCLVSRARIDPGLVRLPEENLLPAVRAQIVFCICSAKSLPAVSLSANPRAMYVRRT